MLNIMRSDLVLTNIGQLATLAGNSTKPKTGQEMKELSIIENGAVTIKDGKIELQGDHRTKVKEALEKMGFIVEIQ